MKGLIKIQKGVEILLRYVGTPMQEEIKEFFEELKDCYIKEKQEFNFSLNHILEGNKESSAKNFLYYIAFNLSKNVLHGPLPDHIHTRMILEESAWSKKYVEYLEGK